MDVSISRFLDSKDATSLEYKLDSFSSVYRRLTGKDVRSSPSRAEQRRS